MFAGKGIFVVAGVVILALIMAGIILFLRGRTGDSVSPLPGSLPGTGDLPPFGVRPPPPAAFPTTPSGPVDQAAQTGASVFTPVSSKESGTFFLVQNPLINTRPAITPPTISPEFDKQLDQEIEDLPLGIRALYQKPGGPTEAELQEAERKMQAQYDALIAEITEFQNAPQTLSAASTTEMCNKIIDDGRAFTAEWGDAGTMSAFGQMAGGCVTQLPFGFPGL